MANFRAKKALGQNFISDPEIISAIADASCAGPSDTVVEIGPGLGALTCELSERAARVVAVELDTTVIPILKGNLAGAQNVEIINEDILKFDWDGIADIVSENSGALRIVGNLPYYITTPILLGILEKDVPAKSITVMVQKEVAERIAAQPGGRDYGVLSVSLQYYAECKKVLDVPAEYFNPRPKVDSAVVHMELKDRRLLDPSEEGKFFSLVKAAFSQRRKTLLNSLLGFGGASIKTDTMSKDTLSKTLQSCGIEPQRRPETLSIEEFANLSKII